MGPGSFGCASFLDESHLLLEIGDLDREHATVQAVPVTGGRPRPLLGMEGCNVAEPRSSQANGTVLFLARCTDVGRSGLYQTTVEGDGSGRRQLIEGVVGAFDVSRDGSSVVFAYLQPAGNGRDPTLYALHLPSRSYAKVADAGVSWPAWPE